MRGVNPLFDSNILIGLLNGTLTQSALSVAAAQPTLPISLITRIEVLAGAGADTDAAVRQLLDLCFVLPVTPGVADLAASLRRTTRLKLPDALIYATALETGRTLVTLNSRDFPPETEAVLIPPAD